MFGPVAKLHNLEFLFLYMILPFSESAFISDSTDDSNRAGHLLEGLDVAPAESYPQEYSGQVVWHELAKGLDRYSFDAMQVTIYQCPQYHIQISQF